MPRGILRAALLGAIAALPLNPAVAVATTAATAPAHIVVHSGDDAAAANTAAVGRTRDVCVSLARAHLRQQQPLDGRGTASAGLVEVDGFESALALLAARDCPGGNGKGTAPTTTVLLCPGLHTLARPARLDARHSFAAFVGLHGGDAASASGGTPGPAVLSGALPVHNFTQAPVGTNTTAAAVTWVATVAAASLDPALNFSVPQQLFAAASGLPSDAGRRTRARHPNLPLDTDDAAPWLHWATQLCPAARQKPGTPPTACDMWARFGFVWNATDDAVFATLEEGDADSDADPSNAVGSDNGGDVQCVVYHGWTASRHHVRAVVAANRSLLFTNPARNFIGYFGLDNTGEGGRRYYLTNHRAFLDYPGEWFLDMPPSLTADADGARGTGAPAGDASLYYIPANEQEAAALAAGTFTAFLPRHTSLLEVVGASNVSFSGPGLQISFSNWACGLYDACDSQSTEWLDSSGVRTVNSSLVSFAGAELSHHGGFPVWIDQGSTDTRVDSCNITDVAAGGVRVGHSLRTHVPPTPRTPADLRPLAVQRPVLFNTSLTDGGHDFPSGTAVFSQFRVLNLTMEHCEVARFSYTAVSLGWSWNYAVQDNTGGALVRHNHVHHLGFPRRETGDAMACFYTLNGVVDARVDGNVCHDVRAYMNGGYCLSQDQGSTNATFTNNLCMRVTGSPHNTHYGMGLHYENNVFALGNFANHYPGLVAENAAPVALRTSPQDSDCGSAAHPGKCPNLLSFSRNVFLQGSDAATVLFEGDFSDSVAAVHHYTFQANAYASDVHNLSAGFPAFGGRSARLCRGCTNASDPAQSGKASWAAWRGDGGMDTDVGGSGDGAGHQDAGGVVVPPGQAVFADPAWAESWNLTLDPAGPVAHAVGGFVPFDATTAGLLPPPPAA